MSRARNMMTDATEAGQEPKTDGLRFTPLRSYVTRARALSRDAGSDLALSRLIPLPRLQG
jgi:hypothetical protein